MADFDAPIEGQGDGPASPVRRGAQARRWAGKAGFSVLDQALASLSNFVLSVVLARVLSESRYGAFSVAFTVFLVLSGVHNALILEPVSVFGPARHSGDLVPYLRRVVAINLAFTAVLAVLTAIGGALFLPAPARPVFFAMAVALPAILLFWLARRSHYLEVRPDLASASSLIYCVVLTAIAGALYLTHRLTGVSAFFALGAGSLAASLFSAIRTRIGFRFLLRPETELRSTARELWEFGRWILPSALFFPLISQVQILLTSGMIDLASAGVLRALQNPVLPIVQVQTALGTLGLPVLARYFAQGAMGPMIRRSVWYIALLGAVAAAYEIAVLATGGLWDRILYGGRFAPYDWLMPVLGLMPIGAALATGCSVVLRAMIRPGLTTATHVIGGLFGLIVSYFSIRAAGIAGAVYALTASQLLTAGVSFVFVFYAFRLPRLAPKTGEQ